MHNGYAQSVTWILCPSRVVVLAAVGFADATIPSNSTGEHSTSLCEPQALKLHLLQ
jgi:hypothetical protein